MPIGASGAKAVATGCVIAAMWACGGSGASAGGADGSGGGGGSPPSDAACRAPDLAPPSTPSPGTASFVLTNHTSETRWVATDGHGCDAVAIDGVPRIVAFACGCECAPNVEGSLRFWALGPGESTTLTWDETRVVTYIKSYTSGFCPSPGECSPTNGGVDQAVASGSYTASFLVTDDATLRASTSLGGVPDAGPPATANILVSVDTRAGQELCPGFTVLKKAFTVPSTFDVSVDVSIDP